MINSQGSAYPPVSRKTPLGLPVEPEVYSLTLHSRNGTTTARQLHSDPDQAGHMYSGSVASTCSLLSRARAVERGPWFPPLPHLWNSSHRDQHPLQRQAVVQELLNMFGSALSKYVFIICSLMCVCVYIHTITYSQPRSLRTSCAGYFFCSCQGIIPVLQAEVFRCFRSLKIGRLFNCGPLYSGSVQV